MKKKKKKNYIIKNYYKHKLIEIYTQTLTMFTKLRNLTRTLKIRIASYFERKVSPFDEKEEDFYFIHQNIKEETVRIFEGNNFLQEN